MDSESKGENQPKKQNDLNHENNYQIYNKTYIRKIVTRNSRLHQTIRNNNYKQSHKGLKHKQCQKRKSMRVIQLSPN